MGDMTKDFSKREFACRCCGASNVSPRLAHALQELRDELGVPLRVLSGYRCPRHNAEVGGASASRHLSGQAADITADIPLLSLYEAACRVPAFLEGGIGLYPSQNFIHLDVRRARARWGQIDRKHVSIEEAAGRLRPSREEDG